MTLKKRSCHLVAAVTAAAATAAATADFTGAHYVTSVVTAEEFGGRSVTKFVVDVYLTSDDPCDVLLNIYNWNDPLIGCPFQSFTGSGWGPTNLGGPFDNEAVRRLDSFVTIGGFAQGTFRPEQVPGAGSSTGFDGNFGGNSTCAPNTNGGWYNGFPPGLNGAVGDVPDCHGGFTLGVLIARFSSTEPFSLDGTTFDATWNCGLGTPGNQDSFEIQGDGCPIANVDCNDNGVEDAEDILDGTSTDCNANLIPDECEDPDGDGETDCDADGIADVCEPDCNADGLPDACAISQGLDTDYDLNGIPDACDSLTVPGDHSTIGAALAAAPASSLILVGPGTYDEALVLDRGVLLIAIDGPDVTTLTRSGTAGPVIVADDAPAGTVLSGFTIANATSLVSDGGGGIDATESDLLVENCVFEGNGATDGGGARFEGGAPTIRNCSFRSNVSQGVGGGLRLVDADATVASCTFEMNTAAAGTLGWAIAATDGFATFTDVEVRFHDGQPVALEGLAGFPDTIMAAERLFIHDNLGRGLVILGNDPQTTTLADSRICGNTDLDGDPVPPTEGAYTNLGDNILFADRCPDLVVPDDERSIQIAINRSIDGDRIAVRPGTYDEGGLLLAGRDLEVVGVDDLFLTRPVVTGPIDASGMPDTGLIRHLAITNGTGVVDVPGYRGLTVGGGLLLDDSEVLVHDCDVFDNQADLGGGVFVRGGAARLEDVSITQNAATSNGGGLHLEGDGSTTLGMARCLVVANDVPERSGSRGGGIDARGLTDATSLVLADSSILGNARENLAQNTSSGSFTDLGGNSIAPAFDCDDNGLEDVADIEDFGTPDCNGNLVPDACDIENGIVEDCDGDGVADPCQLGYSREPRYENHDGGSERATGVSASGTLAWMERFTGRTDLDRISVIEITFGETGPSPAIIGASIAICIWSDPDGDGTPNDALPLEIVPATIEGPLGTAAQRIELPADVTVGVDADFFVGVVMNIPDGVEWHPAAMDDDGASLDSWIAWDADSFSPAGVGSAGLLERLPEVDDGFASSRWMITALPDLESRVDDCNANGLIDTCETGDGTSADCNRNLVPDECDIAEGAPDANLDGIPDACQGQLVFEVPARFPTITSAIEVAPEGARIQLAPGNYAEAIDLGTRNLQIVGDRADPASTILETPGLNRTVVTIAGGQDAGTLIAGVLIENGISSTPEPGFPASSVGGGLYIDGASPVIEDCIVGSNQATRGGGAYLRFSEAVFRRTIFENNLAIGGGAGLWWTQGVITLEDCIIRDNQAQGDGGGLHVSTDGGSITGGSITGNIATSDGAGLWWQGSLQSLVLVDVEISMNIAGGTGGGVFSLPGFIGIEPSGLVACDNFPNQVTGPYAIVAGSTNQVCRCGDLNGDGVVDGVDLGLYLAAGGSGGDCVPLQGCPADVNFDGEISGADLGQILGDWGSCS